MIGKYHVKINFIIYQPPYHTGTIILYKGKHKQKCKLSPANLHNDVDVSIYHGRVGPPCVDPCK